MLWLAPLIGFILCIPFLFGGYQLDDHFLKQHFLEKTVYEHRAIWDYFNWVSNDAETARYREKGIMMATWLTPDSFRFRMFRPLTSVLHDFQFRFFGNSPWVMHLGLLLLYALLIFLCAKLLMRFSTSPTACGIAILLFAINESHAASVAWISAYNTVLCCVFGLFAFMMHDRWRSQKSIGAMLLSVVAFLLALLSSEGGLALMGYLIAYALFVEDGLWRKRIIGLIPSMIIAGCYLIFYILHGFGPRGLGYLSLDNKWQDIIFGILNSFSIDIVLQFLSFPPLLPVLLMSGPWGTVVAVIFCVALVIILKSFFKSSRTVGFFTVGMVLSMLPFVLGLPGGRLLLWAGLGASGLLGELFNSHFVQTGKLRKITGKTLLICNVYISLLFFVPSGSDSGTLMSPSKKLEQTVTTQNTVLLNSWNQITFFYPAAIRYEKGGNWPEHFYPLYCGFDTLTIKRVDERSLLATTPKGWLPLWTDRARRTTELYFKAGTTIDLQLMTATIEKVTCDARPLSVRFTFKKDLTEFAWLKWDKKGPVRCELPPIGGEIRVVTPLSSAM